jgi:hypothetical protein
VQRQTAIRYAAVFGAFGLAILCKPSVVALPLVLILLDWWPLNRFRADPAVGASLKSMRPVLIMLLEKLPFLILGLVATLVTFVGQRDLGLSQPGKQSRRKFFLAKHQHIPADPRGNRHVDSLRRHV